MRSQIIFFAYKAKWKCMTTLGYTCKLLFLESRQINIVLIKCYKRKL